MRYVMFVDRIEIPNVTTVSSSNLFLYDVDNDGDLELVIGNWDTGDLADTAPTNGTLLVLKYGKVWLKCCNLNMVTCVSAGRLCSRDKSLIVALCADSHCYLFDATTQPFLESGNNVDEPSLMRPSYHQKLAFNAKDVRIVDGEGPCDMVAAYSDRVVRLFRWKQSPDAKEEFDGELVLLLKWELAGQISRISFHSTPNEKNLFVASQPGGGFAFLQKKFETYNDRICPMLVYHPPKLTAIRSVETRTWVIGNVKKGVQSHGPGGEPSCNYYMAVCLADGTVLLLDADLDKNEVLWCAQLQVQGELFGLSTLNFTSEDTEDVSVCCWDGSTYIFNYRKDILRFLVGQSCQAFTSGKYAMRRGHNEPVLVYATCESSLLIYYNLNVDSIPIYSLTQKIYLRPSLLKKLEDLGVNTSNSDQVRQAVHYLLYEFGRREHHQSLMGGGPEHPQP
uniref:Integrin-alpha FG-GAP repeat-containing protein 2 n=3 Tax=Schistocephalus solidus TaxID=70667 RepID=A0A0V0J230_SCHSO